MLTRVQRLADPVRWALLRVVLATGRRVDLSGLRILLVVDRARDVHIAKIKEALALIERFAPLELERIRNELHEVIVFAGAGAQYHTGVKACLIGEGYLSRQTPERLAMVLAHEATHAAQTRAGERYETGDRARLEAACVEAEIQLAERIPGTAELIEEARQSLQHPWWTDGKLFERRVDTLRLSGVPKWVVAWYKQAFRPPS